MAIGDHSSQYPWADWLDGRCWFLREGSDFSCLAWSIAGQAHSWAKLAGVAMTARLVTGGVIIQAYPAGSTWKPNLAAIDEGKIRKALENKR